MEIASSASPTLSLNLANHPAKYRAAPEAQKAKMFAFWQQNRERSYAEAGRIFSQRKSARRAFGPGQTPRSRRLSRSNITTWFVQS